MNYEKRCKNEHLMGHNHGHNPHRRGPSSFSMHDPELVFGELKLKEGDSFLDLGCGVGDYSLQVAKIVGASGVVYALDIREELLDGLAEEAAFQGLKNIRTKVSDINSPLIMEDNCIDVCFIATVLHIFNIDKDGETLFNEIRRVLKSDGRLAIIECKKEELPFGPPMHMRISPGELEAVITPYGQHWNGSLLDTYEAVLGFASSMTWNGKNPLVTFTNKLYETGKKVGPLSLNFCALSTVKGMELFIHS